MGDLPAPLRARLELETHEGPASCFEAYGLERALETALAREVALDGGGRLVIDRTEALWAIDGGHVILACTAIGLVLGLFL